MTDQVRSTKTWMFAGGGPQTSKEGVSASRADVSGRGKGAMLLVLHVLGETADSVTWCCEDEEALLGR